ncbi:MAG: cell division protein FtsW [Phycisphaerae bacterium]|mgnify:CR=1 FL=1|nr:cell division protein FtsW [Phycisphaerae bacterium]
MQRTDPYGDMHSAEKIGAVVMILMAMGTVFVFSASASLDQQLNLDRFFEYQGLRQIIFFPLAVLVMLLAASVDHRKLSFAGGIMRSPALYLLAASVLLLILVLIPQLGVERGSARRWLHIPLGASSVSFQPSELAKWSLILFVAAACHRHGFQLHSLRRQLGPVLAVCGGVVGLILVEDFGTAAFAALLVFLMLLVGGAKPWHLLTPLPLALGGFVVALIYFPYRLKRLLAFLYPEKYPELVYQAEQSLLALGSGGLWGRGLGNGICKYDHLPQDTTDFVFAIVGEELGLVGALAVIGLFALFVFLGIRIALRCEDGFGRLLATGIVLAIGIQAAVNIGVATMLLPTKGIPLPFVSGGGTSLLLSAAAVGVLLSIARHPSAKERPEPSPADPD